MKTKSNLFAMFLGATLLALPEMVNAQFIFTTNNDGSLNLSHYTGSGGAVVIPSLTNGLAVTSIGALAFYFSTRVTSVTIPSGVTTIGDAAFNGCSLTNVTIPNSVTTIQPAAFAGAWLTSVTIPSSVISIGDEAFSGCYTLTAITVDTNNPAYSSLAGVLFNQSQSTLMAYPAGGARSYTVPSNVLRISEYSFDSSFNLTNVTIGTNVSSIGNWAFGYCFSLTGVYFLGNAPNLGSSVFSSDTNATVYYFPWTTGWGTPGTPFGGAPTALWLPQVQTSKASLGVRSNQFGFNITWAGNMVVVVEACTNLANPAWTPVGTNTLIGGSSYFSDSQWTNYPGRFYRLRSP